MKTLKLTAAKAISAAACELFAPATLSVDEVMEMLEYPPDGTMGDLALPCFKLSRTLRRAPAQIAEALAAAQRAEASAEAARAAAEAPVEVHYYYY